MTRHGDDVAGLEQRGLLENSLTNLREREAIARGVEAIGSPRVLDRLKRYATDAALLEREVDDLADLVIVQALLQRDDQRRRDVVLVEMIQRAAANVAEILASQFAKRQAAQRGELQVSLEGGHVILEPPRERC